MAACRTCGSVACANHLRCMSRYGYARWQKDWIGTWGSLALVYAIAEHAQARAEQHLGHGLTDGERERIRGHAGQVLLQQMQRAA